MDFPAPLLSFLHMDMQRDREREIQEMRWGWEKQGNPLWWDNRAILGLGCSCLSPRALLISGFISINE